MISNKQKMSIANISITAMMSAVAFVLMLLEFPIPLVPSFIKFDVSDLPALLTSFLISPLNGIAVCFLKNLLHFAFSTTTGGIGEISNFILGALLVVPSGYIYAKTKTKIGAVVGISISSVIMATAGVFTNYYIVYPIYTKFMPLEQIVSAYSAINPGVTTLWNAMWIFNFPFNIAKGLVCALLMALIYAAIMPVLKKYRNKNVKIK